MALASLFDVGDYVVQRDEYGPDEQPPTGFQLIVLRTLEKPLDEVGWKGMDTLADKYPELPPSTDVVEGVYEGDLPRGIYAKGIDETTAAMIIETRQVETSKIPAPKLRPIN